MPYHSVGFDCQMPLLMNPAKKNCIHWLLNVLDVWKHDESGLSWLVSPQAAQGHYVWVRASEVIWSEYTRIISVLSDAK